MSYMENIGASAKSAWNEALTEIQKITFNYPLIATISAVIFSILGIAQLSALSVAGLLSSVVLIGLAGAIVYSIFQDPATFFEQLKKSVDFCKDKGTNNSGDGQRVFVEVHYPKNRIWDFFHRN